MTENRLVDAFSGETGIRAGGRLRDRIRAWTPAAVAFVAVIVVWETGIRVFDVQAFVLPAPSVIVRRFIETSEIIWSAGLGTLIEAVGGLILGTVAAVVVAGMTVRWAPVREGVMPFAIAASSVPIIALAPIANGMFPITSPAPKIAVVAIVVFFPVMINTARGLIEVDPDELELMRSYAATQGEIMRRIRIPHSLPFFFSALKVVAVLSIVFAIVAEYFGGPQDVLGQYILTKASLFVYPDAWAGILVASLLGVGLYGLILIAERFFMPWHISFRSADGS